MWEKRMAIVKRREQRPSIIFSLFGKCPSATLYLRHFPSSFDTLSKPRYVVFSNLSNLS